MHLEVDILVF